MTDDTRTRQERAQDAAEHWIISGTVNRAGEPVHAYLGWTLKEYEAWAMGRGSLPPEREGAV